MGERRHIRKEVSRLFIPERHLWTPEAAERFLDDDGNLRRTADGEFDFEPIEKPLIHPTEYPIVDIEEYAEAIKGLFVEKSKFPRVYRKDVSAKLAGVGIDLSNHELNDIAVHDNIEHAQQQKFYKSSGTIVDMDTWRFCDNPERTFVMQWLAHNVVTNVFADAPVPDKELMTAHTKGANLSLDVMDLAIVMLRRGHGFNMRLNSIQSGAVQPGTELNDDGCDEQTAEYFKELSTKVKDEWKRRLDTYEKEMPEMSYFNGLQEYVLNAKPKAVVSMLGRFVTRDAWALSPYFSGHTSFRGAQRAQLNRYARRVARDSRLVA